MDHVAVMVTRPKSALKWDVGATHSLVTLLTIATSLATPSSAVSVVYTEPLSVKRNAASAGQENITECIAREQDASVKETIWECFVHRADAESSRVAGGDVNTTAIHAVYLATGQVNAHIDFQRDKLHVARVKREATDLRISHLVIVARYVRTATRNGEEVAQVACATHELKDCLLGIET